MMIHGYLGRLKKKFKIKYTNFFYLFNIQIHMPEKNTDSPTEIIDKAVESSKKAIELQNEANLRAPKSPEEIVKKAQEQNKNPEALAGSPQGLSEQSQNMPKTPAGLYKKLAEGPKKVEEEYKKKLDEGKAGRETYLKLADVPAVPPTNLAAACLTGTDTDNPVKSNIAAAGTSDNSVIAVPETSPINPVDVLSTPGQASGSSISAIRTTVDLSDSTPGRTHLNPVLTQTSANVIETPGYNPTLPGRIRLNPVKVPGNPPSIVDVPHDGFLAKGKHSNVASLNLPPSSATVPLALPTMRSVNVPPMAAKNSYQTFVNVPGSINVPPGPTGVARTGTDPHMNPVKLSGAPLVVQTPINVVPNGAVLNIAETHASFDNPNTTAELIEHFVVGPDDLIEHFVDGPEPGTSEEEKNASTTPTTGSVTKSTVPADVTNTSTTATNDVTDPENPDSDGDDDENDGDADSDSDSDSPDAQTEILNPKKTPDDDSETTNVVAPKKTGEIDGETPKEVYKQLQDAQKLEVTEEKKETDEPKEVYKKLQNAQPELVQNVNASQIRDVHLNPAKTANGFPSVLTAAPAQVAQAVSKLDIVAPPSVSLPGGGNTAAKYVASTATGNVHLNPAKNSAPSVIHTPDGVLAGTGVHSSVNSVNVPGQSITVPLATGVGSAVQSHNVPPMTTNLQSGPAGSVVGPSTNIPSGPISVTTQQ